MALVPLRSLDLRWAGNGEHRRNAALNLIVLACRVGGRLMSCLLLIFFSRLHASPWYCFSFSRIT
jgi:hypothetical protein